MIHHKTTFGRSKSTNPHNYRHLTVIHDGDPCFVINERRETENTDFRRQFGVLRLDELNAMLVSVIVDGFQL